MCPGAARCAARRAGGRPARPTGALASHSPSALPPQTLSNLLWGYCKLDVYPQGLFEAAAAELVERFRAPDTARQFRAQELSNSLYAFAQGNIINERLLSAYERELASSWVELDGAGRERRVSRLDDFTSQARRAAAAGRWGLGRRPARQQPQPAAAVSCCRCCPQQGGLHTPPLPRSRLARPCRPRAAPQALANTLWSFANLRWYPVQLLEPITRAVGRKLQHMSTQEISNSIWAYAKCAPPGAARRRGQRAAGSALGCRAATAPHCPPPCAPCPRPGLPTTRAR